MPAPRAQSSFVDRLIGLIHRLDPKDVQALVERLARERSFLATIFETIEDGVVVLDEKGRIVFFNEAVTQMLGFDPESAEGTSIREHLKELDWDALLLMDRNGGMQVQRHELEVQYPKHRYLTLFISPLDGSAVGSSGLVLILHDVTEMRQKKTEEIENERVQALTLLAASVAHEIGNPLNALNIHLQLMERELGKLKAEIHAGRMNVQNPAKVGVPLKRRQPVAVNAETESEPLAPGEISLRKLDQYLDVAKGEITRLDYIITQFLQAIRPTQPKFQQVDVNQIVEEALQLLRPEIDNRGVTLVEKFAPGLPEARMDPVQIKQVLVNLIKNAIQAMTKGGQLVVGTQGTSEGVWISVRDTGSGIPSEQLNRIFEPFYTTKKKGSGLGLMIVQRIVRDHGGRVELESHVGKGTQFRIWLPNAQTLAPRLLPAPHE